MSVLTQPGRRGSPEPMWILRGFGAEVAAFSSVAILIGRFVGIVRAVARGVRRTKSKFGARLEPFGHVDVLYPDLDAFSTGTRVVTDGGSTPSR